MKRFRLGKLESVSALCLGTMYFGTKTDKKTAFRLLDHYLDAGGNFVDTSNNYAFWVENALGDESEEVLGKWFAMTGNRTRVVLGTKVGARPRVRGVGAEDMEGLSYETIISAVEGSLKRLKTDYLDLYYAHVDWYEYPLEERLRAFDTLVQHGKIREVGVSNIFPWRLERSHAICDALTFHKSVAIQLKHSYLQPKRSADFWVQKQITPEWMDFVTHNPDSTLIAYSPLLSGAYAGRPMPEEYDTPGNLSRMQVLEETGADLQLTKNQLVIAWMLNSKPGILPLIAASSVTQLSENLAAGDLSLTEEVMSKLNETGD